ncbi:phosphoribosylamine--glycine ligase [Rhodohalobacter sp. SW132]|nr:phosphoribosylamine--glycine ligase [Rhodohalobacter sp. SW132]
MNVLLIGSGGRESAIAWKLSRSELLDTLYIAPGNPGTEPYGTNISLDTDDFVTVEKKVKELGIELVIVGPEQPLVDGIEDTLSEKGIPVFGPSAAAAQLEGSKSFAKEFMKQYGIPTADYQTFEIDQFDKASEYIKQKNRYPVVLKADGLAGGKGVFICENQQEVEKRLSQLSEDENLKSAAATLVVEEFMEGEEASVFVISDGESFRVIHNAQDHKRIGEGDTGLNTGGMGAYAPAPLVTDSLKQRIDDEITRPTIEGMKASGHPYKGILYIGLMMTEDGPKVVEYNCRFGDPECQVILPPLKNDLLKLMISATRGEIDTEPELVIHSDYFCTVVLASGGYPGPYKKGLEISGADQMDDRALLFHAGTANKDGKLVTNGGRVLNVVGRGKTLKQAIDHAYTNVEKVTFKDCYYRRDIGKKGLKKLA